MREQRRPKNVGENLPVDAIALDVEVTSPETGAEAMELCYADWTYLLDDALVEIQELQAGSLDPGPHCLDQGRSFGCKGRTSRLDVPCRNDDRNVTGLPDRGEIADESGGESMRLGRCTVPPQGKLVVHETGCTAPAGLRSLRGCGCRI